MPRRARLERALSDAIGLEVKIGGELRLDLLPRLEVDVSDVTIANLPGRPSPYLLEIGALDLGLDPWPLLRGNFELDRIHVENADLHLEPGADGDLDLPDDLEDSLEELTGVPPDDAWR